MTRANEATVPDQHDVIVIGAGPAGLAAAEALLERGCSVLSIDEQPSPGGQIWRGAVNARSAADWPGGAGTARDARAACAVLQRPGIVVASGATVIDARVDASADTVAVDWLPAPDDGERGLRTARARALLIATGAQERPLLFPGAELPGVMTVGAVQGAMKQSSLVPCGPGIVLAGQGPLLQLSASQLLHHGTRVDAILDLATDDVSRAALAPRIARAALADPVLLARGAALGLVGRKIARYCAVRELRAHGDESVERVSFTADGWPYELPCRLLAVHDGVVPNVQLTRLLNLEHVWRETQQAFAPITDATGRVPEQPVWVSGDARGIAGAELSLQHGRLAGLDIVRALGASDVDDDIERLQARIARRLPARDLVDRLFPALPVDRFANEDTVVCRCEGVTLGQIDAAIAAGATGVNRVKTFTRCGMGPCQGRTCGNALTRLVAARRGVTPDEAGFLRIRAPLKPVLIADYLGLDDGPGDGHGDSSPAGRSAAR